MPEMHLKQPGFIYITCCSFTKSKESVLIDIEIVNTNYISKNDPDKACLQHYMAHGKYKSLVKRTESDKALKDKA